MLSCSSFGLPVHAQLLRLFVRHQDTTRTSQHTLLTKIAQKSSEGNLLDRTTHYKLQHNSKNKTEESRVEEITTDHGGGAVGRCKAAQELKQ